MPKKVTIKLWYSIGNERENREKAYSLAFTSPHHWAPADYRRQSYNNVIVIYFLTPLMHTIERRAHHLRQKDLYCFPNQLWFVLHSKYRQTFFGFNFHSCLTLILINCLQNKWFYFSTINRKSINHLVYELNYHWIDLCVRQRECVLKEIK